MPTRRRKRGEWADWFETAAAMNAAAYTISMRTMRMQDGFRTGRFATDPENARMVSEKMEAAGAGLFAVSAEWSRLWWRAAAGLSPLTAAGAVADAQRLAMAAARPGFKTARANAKRLAKR